MIKYKVIFEEPKKENNLINFNDILIDGDWVETTDNNHSFANCVLISSDNYYDYYLLFDYLKTIKETHIFRKKSNIANNDYNFEDFQKMRGDKQ
jgi:hypothetical protein